MQKDAQRPARTKPYRGIGMEGRIARWYARNTANDMDDFRKLADRISKEIPMDGRVLEVAPGPGYFSIELAKRGSFAIKGLDISKTFVEIATRNALKEGVRVSFERGNASAMPFLENSFDFVVCRAAFKNFTQPVEALNEMHRVLKPGGRAVIIDLRNDASMADINAYIKGKGPELGVVNTLIYKVTFRFLLIPRAYSKAQFMNLVSESSFGSARIDESEIGFDITLTK